MAEIREVTGLGREMKTAALAAEIWNEYYAELLGSAQIAYMLNRFQSEEALHREEADGYRTFWVLEENGTTPVGYFLVKENEPVGKLFLSKLYVRASSRGKGVSRPIVAFLKRLAREAGLHTIWLTVNKGNATVGLYKKYGLRITDSVVTDIGGGYVMDDYIMEMPV